jgi:hypothetical protein
MPQVGFEPTIPVFVRAKTVHALYRTDTVIGVYAYRKHKFVFAFSELWSAMEVDILWRTRFLFTKYQNDSFIKINSEWTKE